MKKIIIALCLLGGTVISNKTAQAQVSIGINIGRPGWLNAGFRGNFCYLPAIGCYYDVNNGLYYFQDGGNWVGYNSLPPAYAGYNLANFYQVPMYGRNPYMYYSRHYNMYRQYAYMGMPNGGYYRGGGRPYGGGYRGPNYGGGYGGNGPRNNWNNGPRNGGGPGNGHNWNNGGGPGNHGGSQNYGGGFNGGGRFGGGNSGGNNGRGFNGRR